MDTKVWFFNCSTFLAGMMLQDRCECVGIKRDVNFAEIFDSGRSYGSLRFHNWTQTCIS